MNDTETTLTAQLRHDRMTVQDSDGGRWWPTDAGQNVIDASEDPEGEAISLAESHDRKMGEWHQ